MRLRNAVLSCALLFGVLPAAADHYASFYVIPVASHTRGAHATEWMSDVAVQNFQTTALTVDMTFVRSGEGSADNVVALGASVVVPPGGSVLLKDVVGGLGLSESGSILIGANAPFAVTSRSYITTPSGDTIGQTVVPARDFLESSTGDTNNSLAVAYVPGLISNARFRSNLGFTAATSNPSAGMVVEVTVRRADGSVTGTRSFFVPGGSIRHLQFSTSSIGPGGFDVGSAEFRITSGDGAVVPYASVVDNGSADAVFVAGQFPPNIAGASASSTTPLSRFLVRSVFE